MQHTPTNMILSGRILTLFIVITLCLNGSTKLRGDEVLVGIHIKDDMPPNSETVRLNCIKGYWDKLHPGDEFHFGELRKFRFVCKAIWRDKDGIWMAFEPVRDRDYRHVYSSVREDGFYISYDQSNWKILNSWTG